MATGISVTISANDAATAVISKVQTGLENLGRKTAAARVPMDRMAASLGRFGQITGVNQIASDVNGLGRQIGSAAASLGRFAPALGAITGAASVAGLAALVERWTAFGSRLGFDAQRIGMTASSLHGLQGAARLAGSSAEALTSGMQTLGDNLTNAVVGRSPETVQMLSALGISFRDSATGGTRLAQDVLPEIADKISRIENPTRRAMVATTLLGSAGESLLPLFARGAQGIRDYNAAAESYGVFSKRGVDAAQALREEQTRLALSIEGVGNAVSAEVAPVLVPMLRQLSDWVRDNRGEIAGFFQTIAKAMKSWVDDGGLAKLVESLKAIYDTLARIVGIADSVGHGLRKAWDAGAALPQVDEYGRLVQPPAPATGLPPPPATVPTVPGQNNPPGWFQRHLPTWLGGQPNRPPSGPMGGWENGVTPSPQSGDSQLTSSATRSAFIAKWRSEAERIAPRVGTGADNILAHWAQETGWGTSEHDNNVGNLQALRPGPNTVTRGDTHGDGSRYQAPFLTFRTPEESANAYASWVERHGAVGPGGADSPVAFGQRLRNSRYMENPNAPQDIARTRQQVDRQQIAIPGSERLIPAVPAFAAPVPPVPASAPPGAQGQPGPDGKATVRLQFDNPPPGMRTTTVAQGGLRVETPTLGLAP